MKTKAEVIAKIESLKALRAKYDQGSVDWLETGGMITILCWLTEDE